ncbi:hypothetical protein [Sulfuriroseicoccus oceanibius]|uniref:Uncharacterized protein n=1 Tax=Sulfuriroseicoccus oceanibius TaxID=2707525 RepID=A0A6B3LDC6_9BACT|nr:hypothetical protein [Sulfuriroseicoccus oceanibius]QQL45078.1 hypothetical protein G3M56_000375 [Sulfuriroseicoccus oceanibius]
MNTTITRITALLAIGLAIWWLYTLYALLWIELPVGSGGGWDAVLLMSFTTIFGLTFVVPAAMGIWFGSKLWLSPTKRSIKGSVGAIVLIPALRLELMTGRFDWYGLATIPIAIVAITAYVIISRTIIERWTTATIEKGEFIGRGILKLVAVLIHLSLIQMGTRADAIFDIPFWLAAFTVPFIFYFATRRFVPEWTLKCHPRETLPE